MCWGLAQVCALTPDTHQDDKVDAFASLLAATHVDSSAYNMVDVSQFIARRQCRYRPLCERMVVAAPVKPSPADVSKPAGEDANGSGGDGDSVERESPAASSSCPADAPDAPAVASTGLSGRNVGGAGGAGAGTSNAAATASELTQPEGMLLVRVDRISPPGVASVGPGTKIVLTLAK